MPLPFGFNPMDHEDLHDFVALSLGVHQVTVVGFALPEANAENKTALTLILASEHGLHRDFLAIWHDNEVRARIEHQRLAAYCKAAGVQSLGSDGTEIELIFNIPINVHVTPRKDDPEKSSISKITAVDTEVKEPKKEAKQFSAWTPKDKPVSASKVAPKERPEVISKIAPTDKLPWE